MGALRVLVADGTLTERETEILQLVAEGHSSKNAAAVLRIRTPTAEKHRSNLMKKLDCHTVSALVRYAIRNGIIGV
jgi:DNA-binding CsgD family transcriptional regulator